ncbi:adenylate/guanylate cyclase domain-containing protein [Aurantimonas sp. HBX-1]|uniref:adenylate/guanylate cyclase domain-containing protein n=1 Tax=Aurantimonas sp. HBX-1 TaxID=2906072 RepID=UPI001F1E058A|nr:adenylate/guanylate cyclase domain-containing protein [Aurantimonas sp. HBX-1]UIJ70366.1 adenylate/guanylate cyclase domain-containing protein [Aurantimonas sp. HBX-1]
MALIQSNRVRPHPAAGDGVVADGPASVLGRRSSPGRLNPLLASGALASVIFAVDTLVRVEFAVAVLYVVVVLVVAASRNITFVCIAAIVCIVLTVTSWLLVHRWMLPDSATLRMSMSVAAIAVTTLLACRSITAAEDLIATQRQRANLARFFPPQLVNELADLNMPTLVRSQPAAVLFADMVGFTAFCADASADETMELLRDLHRILSDRVFANGGMIDKYLGDGLFAVFGVPHTGARDATNAVLSALEIVTRISEWNMRRAAAGKPPIRIVVGIHYGEVLQGEIGGVGRFELAVVGDTVNVASRVEAHCRELDVDLLVTASIVEALHSEGSMRLAAKLTDEGAHILRGRSEAVHLHGLRMFRAKTDVLP